MERRRRTGGSFLRGRRRPRGTNRTGEGGDWPRGVPSRSHGSSYVGSLSPASSTMAVGQRPSRRWPNLETVFRLGRCRRRLWRRLSPPRGPVWSHSAPELASRLAASSSASPARPAAHPPPPAASAKTSPPGFWTSQPSLPADLYRPAGPTAPSPSRSGTRRTQTSRQGWCGKGEGRRVNLHQRKPTTSVDSLIRERNAS